MYLETTQAILSPALAELEAKVIATQLGLEPGGRYLDLGCGHGRHASALRRAGFEVVGVDRSALALAAAARTDPAGTWVEADLLDLPFGDGEFDGAYAWYASLFYGPEGEHRPLLREINRVLRGGARLLCDGPNPIRLAAEPLAEFDRTLDDGRRIEERCAWRDGWEEGWRRLTSPDGTSAEAKWRVRHYDEDDLTDLLQWTGFEVELVCNEAGRPYEPDRSVDLVAVAHTKSTPRGEE